MNEDTSTPEQPGTAIFHTERTRIDVEPGSSLPGPTHIIVTRADKWIIVSREALVLWADEVRRDAAHRTITLGRPDSVTYRYVRRIDEHRDLYERIDEPIEPAPAKPLTVADYERINPMCEHGIVKGLITCPRCEPEEQAAAEASVRKMMGLRECGHRSPCDCPPPVVDEALREITEFATRSAAHVDELTEQLAKADERKQLLTEVLNEVLGSFTHQGYPGEPCLRTGWIGTRIVARWRRIAAGRPDYDELIERLAGVELTDWQRELLREVWEYREMHGRWPGRIHSENGRRNGVATEHEALRQLVQLAERAEGSR